VKKTVLSKKIKGVTLDCIIRGGKGGRRRRVFRLAPEDEGKVASTLHEGEFEKGELPFRKGLLRKKRGVTGALREENLLLEREPYPR